MSGDFVERHYNPKLVSREDGRPARERVGSGEIIGVCKLKHSCDLPGETGFSNGTMWRCDCGRRWEFWTYEWCRRYWPWPR